MIADPTAHPVSDLFPMLPDDELATLAADIKARGQLQPIVLDAQGRILDGRNRLAACRVAGVEPVFTTYEGDDPDGYALMVNIARREMTKGQKAMVVARAIKSANLICSTRDAAKKYGINAQYFTQSNVVLDHVPDEADRVLELDRISRHNQQLQDENAALRAAITRIQDLHHIDTCTWWPADGTGPFTGCVHCLTAWPCATIAAIGNTP